MPQPAPDAASTSLGASRTGWPWWVAGLVLGLVVLGPGLAPGPLLNLDLLVTPSIPVPPGIFGLGPALTRESLADKPLDSLASTIYGGRPGTPMAPWKAMLSEADALWIAEQLLAGFPEPSKAPR